MASLYIKPAPGLKVRDHVYPHPFIPEDGCRVEEHPYWWRKLTRGDVVLADEPTTLKTKATAKAKED